MRYTKPPLSIKQQIDLLKSRGLDIPDQERAAHYLYHLNYYRLSGYMLPFQEGAEHRFQAGTTFEQVLNLYLFDRKLRLLLMDAIERIEVSVRTQWAYLLAHQHGSQKVYNTIVLMRYMMALICPGSKWESRLIELLKEHNGVDATEMGFPNEWDKMAILADGDWHPNR